MHTLRADILLEDDVSDAQLREVKMTVRPYKPYTRGEDIAIVALRFLADWSSQQIGTAIGRTQGSVSERLGKLGVRVKGGREWAWRFLTENGHPRRL